MSKTATQIYYKLYLPSKEIYTLQILINIISSFDLYKNKKNNINFDETDKNKIKDELKKEINQYYKLSINFCNDLINF